MNEKSQTARRCDCEFKENAVALVRGGRTITSVARELGITTWSLASVQTQPHARVVVHRLSERKIAEQKIARRAQHVSG